MATSRPAFAALSVAANIERHKLARGEPWLLLLDLQYPGAGDPTAAQFHVRLARNTDNITFDAGDGLGPQVYQAFNFELGDFVVSTNGSIPEGSVKVSNVMRLLQGAIEQYGGCVGASLTFYVLNAANPAGEAELAMNFTVMDTLCDLKLVKFKLGASSPLRRLFPLYMYRPNFCAWTYNSPALQAAQAAATAAGNTAFRNPGRFCGYTGSMTECSHTIDGATGCRAHFPNAPMRALLFPGIDTNAASVASVV